MDNVALITAWEVSRKSGKCVLPHEHDFYEFVYYCCGDGLSKAAEMCCPITANACVVIPPHTLHEESHIKDCRIICIGFRCDEALTAGAYMDSHGELLHIARSIVAETTNQPLRYKEMAILKLRELLLQLLRQQEILYKPATKDFEYAISYIAQNYHEKIALNDMAKQLHLSYDYFQHRFRELVGESPQQFLISKRLEAAERMLVKKNISITEISERCGFSNSAQFSMMYKRSRKKTPRQARKEAENKEKSTR